MPEYATLTKFADLLKEVYPKGKKWTIRTARKEGKKKKKGRFYKTKDG